MADTQVKKEVRYVNRDFANLRANLVNYAKVYYPETYKDFNDASFGALLFDMVAYVGDILSFYFWMLISNFLLFVRVGDIYLGV